MAYAHPARGERCAQCNDPASRVVGTRPLCVVHFSNIIDRCTTGARRSILNHTDMTPDGFTAWAELLRHGIAIGVITDDEAAKAWNTARDFAA